LGLLWLSWPTASGRGSPWLWPALGLLGLAVAVAGLFWPTFLGELAYGCQPGAAVFLTVAGVQWLLHERHRRRPALLPSFSWARPGWRVACGGRWSTRGRPPPCWTCSRSTWP